MNKKQAIKHRQAKHNQETHAADILKGNLVAEQQSPLTVQARIANTLEEQIIASHETRIDHLSQLLGDGYHHVGVLRAQVKDLETALEERDQNFDEYVAEQKRSTDAFLRDRDEMYEKERGEVDVIHRETVEKISAIHDEETWNTDALHEEAVDEICRIHGERIAELVGNVGRLEERIKELEGRGSGGGERAAAETQRAEAVSMGEVGQRPKLDAAMEGKRSIEKGKQETDTKRREKSEEMSEGKDGEIREPVDKGGQETGAKRRGRSEEPSAGKCVVS